jgi:hypothetical protein
MVIVVRKTVCHVDVVVGKKPLFTKVDKQVSDVAVQWVVHENNLRVRWNGK